MGGSVTTNIYNDYLVDASSDLTEGKDRVDEAAFSELTEDERNRLFGVDSGNVSSLQLPKYGAGSGTSTPA